MTKLLINDRPMTLLPSLAEKIGHDEAIVLQQIQYWITTHEENENYRTFKNDRWWVYNTLEEWQRKQFRWWSVDTIKRILLTLEKMGLILAERFEQAKWNQRKWYSIDYEAVAKLEELEIQGWKLSRKDLIATISEKVKTASNPHGYTSGQIAPINGCNLPSLISANCPNDLYTETTLTTNPDLLHVQSPQITERESAAGVTTGHLEDERSSPACVIEKELKTPWNENAGDGRSIDEDFGDPSRNELAVKTESMASYAEASEGVKQETGSSATGKNRRGSLSLVKNTLEDSYSAAQNFRKKKKERKPAFHRTGVFSPIGAGKAVQRAVLRAMQIWVWDEWKDYGFRIVKAPDGVIWYYDTLHGWQSEDEIMSITHMIDVSNSGYSGTGTIDTDELNEWAMELFDRLKRDKALLNRFSKEPAPVVMEIDIEDVDWDELPKHCYEESEAALPY